MRFGCLISLANVLVAAALFPTSTATAQTSHAEAKAQVEARDARKHNKLKTELVPTAGGAVAGGVVAGPAGAFAGAKAGHGVGTVFHAVKKHHDIKQVEKHGRPRHRVMRRTHTVRTRTNGTRRTLR